MCCASTLPRGARRTAVQRTITCKIWFDSEQRSARARTPRKSPGTTSYSSYRRRPHFLNKSYYTLLRFIIRSTALVERSDWSIACSAGKLARTFLAVNVLKSAEIHNRWYIHHGYNAVPHRGVYERVKIAQTGRASVMDVECLGRLLRSTTNEKWEEAIDIVLVNRTLGIGQA